MRIPICCIAYNRLESLSRLLHSLSSAYYEEEVTLIISIDKSDTDLVEKYADSYDWKHGDKLVIKHKENLGLRNHIISCGDLLQEQEYDALVILEDDITVSESFYMYVQQCVEQYKDNLNIAGISLYSFPLNYHNRRPFIPLRTESDVYLMNCAQSWGQVWMKKQWFAFKEWYNNHEDDFGNLSHLPGSICNWPKSSWLKYHTRYCIEENKYFIYPYVSLSTNNADTGTHEKSRSTIFQVPLLIGEKKKFNLSPKVEYDGFFENKNLAKYLNVPQNELCVDLYGEKENKEGKKYWLTRQIKKYKVVKSFNMDVKPWEANIIYDKSGNQIFLYNTQEKNTLSCLNILRKIHYTNDLCQYLYAYESTSLSVFCKRKVKKILEIMSLILKD